MKRSEALSPLSHDHFEGLHLARTLRTGLDAGTDPRALSAAVLRFWEGDLARHFRQEEVLLVAPLKAVDAPALVARMVAEHHALQALVETLRGTPEDAGTLRTFADTLQAHIRFEERAVFPHLEQHLDPDALRRIGEGLRGSPEALATTRS